MEWIDYAIIAVVVISTIISLFRGFIREAVSLVGWCVAFVVAKNFYLPMGAILQSQVENVAIRNSLAAVILFVVTLFLFALVNVVIGRMLAASGLNGIDRVLGMLFGALRGVLVVASVLFLIAYLTKFPEDESWQNSVLIPHFQLLAEWFFNFMAESTQVTQ